jgi:hypothetical protein
MDADLASSHILRDFLAARHNFLRLQRVGGWRTSLPSLRNPANFSFQYQQSPSGGCKCGIQKQDRDDLELNTKQNSLEGERKAQEMLEEARSASVSDLPILNKIQGRKRDRGEHNPTIAFNCYPRAIRKIQKQVMPIA